MDDLRKDEAQTSEELAAMARARIARTVVHELEPIVGLIEYYASSEFPSYVGSQTKSHVERLAAMLRAIETLGKISATPHVEVVDITLILNEVVAAEQTKFDVDIRLEGPIGLRVNTDAGLVRVIVGNGVRNACESILQVGDRPTAVSVIYGATDREAWVTIADNGVGLPSGSTENLFEMGTSTKEDHLGMGLTLCSEAARALGGDLRLITDSASTRLELSLPFNRGGEDASSVG
ncbi:sensor histidine kinase [Mycobacterium camsae]|uniref:sensor histidine kinase n=1 Tax=Mycobacterium gordonae TaxID=1778 RepID=UPI00197FA8D5|nr:HAMP domain-containing sensor histidine kinase [Mycobacterium gordonae]